MQKILALFICCLASRAAFAAEPPGLKDIPGDAVLFLDADVKALRASAWGKTAFQLVKVLEQDPKTGFELKLLREEGIEVDKIERVSAFAKSLPNGLEDGEFAVIVRYVEAIKKESILPKERLPKNGESSVIPLEAKRSLIFPDERTFILCTNSLADHFTGKENKAAKKKPLSPYLEMAVNKPLTFAVDLDSAGVRPQEVQRGTPQIVKDMIDLCHLSTGCIQVDVAKGLTVEAFGYAPDAASAATAERGFKGLVKFAITLQEIMKTDGERIPAGKELERIKLFSPALQGFRKSLDGLQVKQDGRIVRAKMEMIADFPLEQTLKNFEKVVLEESQERKQFETMKRIGLAMFNYESAYGTFPSAAICDKKGKPLLSWRVVLLPYLEQNALYAKFKLDEPWDSENNKKLIPQMPKIFLLDGQDPKSTKTHYQIFHGKGAMFELKKGTRITEITDGTSNTLMTLVAEEATEWTKPGEIEYDPKAEAHKYFKWENGRARIGLGDGSCRFINKTLSNETLHHLIQKADGNVINLDK